MGGDVQPWYALPSGNYTYYPFMLYSAGNAALWNAYVEPIGTCAEDYIFTQAINNTTAAGYTVVTKNLALSQGHQPDGDGSCLCGLQPVFPV